MIHTPAQTHTHTYYKDAATNTSYAQMFKTLCKSNVTYMRSTMACRTFGTKHYLNQRVLIIADIPLHDNPPYYSYHT